MDVKEKEVKHQKKTRVDSGKITYWEKIYRTTWLS